MVRGSHGACVQAEVSGTGKKGARQKGLGKARVGSRRAPQFRHGGRAFPKRPRSFDVSLWRWFLLFGVRQLTPHAQFPLPKAIRKLGLINALSAKYLQGNVFVVPELKLEDHKTKSLVASLEAHNWDSVLFVGGKTLGKRPFSLFSISLSSLGPSTQMVTFKRLPSTCSQWMCCPFRVSTFTT